MVMQGTDMKVAEAPSGELKDFRIPDAYEDWLEKEKVLVHKTYYVPSMKEIEVGPWERKGGEGAVVHIDNAHMPNDLHVVDIAPGGRSEPERHMYEINFYVVSGRGATTVWQDEGGKQTFEWKAGSLFTIPLNAWYQHFNGSGDEKARYIATTNAPPMMRLFRDEEFIFNNDFQFKSRYTDDESYFSGNGTLYNKRIWETNFIPNAPDMALYGWKERGAGGINAMLQMGQNDMGNHISEFPIGTYKKAHRHGPGAHLLITGGVGFALVWKEDDMSDLVKADWQRGSLYLPTQDAENEYFHQHFNVGTTPARYINMSPSNSRKYAYRRGVNDPAKQGEIRAMVSIKEGGIQLEYEDESPRVHRIFEEELAKHGQECRMKNLIADCAGVPGPENKKGELKAWD